MVAPMSMSDCIRCDTTPCVCGHGYWFMDMARLRDVAEAASAALRARDAGEAPPPAVQAELDRRAAQRAAYDAMMPEARGAAFSVSINFGLGEIVSPEIERDIAKVAEIGEAAARNLDAILRGKFG
jgi:hypothetical protein